MPSDADRITVVDVRGGSSHLSTMKNNGDGDDVVRKLPRETPTLT